MSGIAAGIVIGGKVDFQRFTNESGTHTWNKPAGVTKVYMEIIGAGGGGGGANGNQSTDRYGGAGGGGAFARGLYPAESLPTTLTVTVGSGGGGGAGGSEFGVNGTVGGNSRVTGTGVNTDPGNSGGPLFNSAGKLIGINTMIISSGESVGSVGLGFAIDGQYAQTIVKRLENGKKIQWSYIGLHFRLLNMEETNENNLEFGSNVIIMKVVQGGVAVGELREKDIITKMDDVVVSHKTFATMIASLEPRTKITLEVLRDKKIINVDLVLGYRPE